jgi:hypothetical protein
MLKKMSSKSRSQLRRELSNCMDKKGQSLNLSVKTQVLKRKLETVRVTVEDEEVQSVPSNVRTDN